MHDVPLFDRLAPLYDMVMWGTDAARLERGLEAAERPVRDVLDVGGGSGRAASAIAGGERRVVVVDAAAGMLREARGVGHEVVQGDAGRLPVRDGGDAAGVDAVVIVDAVHHFPDVQAALAEIERVLRPGGVLVVRDFDPTTLRGGAIAAAERVVGFPSTFSTPTGFADAVEAAGLAATVLERGWAYTVVGVKPGEA